MIFFSMAYTPFGGIGPFADNIAGEGGHLMSMKKPERVFLLFFEGVWKKRKKAWSPLAKTGFMSMLRPE